MSHNTGFQVERIAFFSDAVFAIAVTLLVIEIRASVFSPETTGEEAFDEFPHLIAGTRRCFGRLCADFIEPAQTLFFRCAPDSKNGLYAAGEKLDAGRVKVEVLFPVLVSAATTVVGCFNNVVGRMWFALFALEPLFIRLVLRGKSNET